MESSVLHILTYCFDCKEFLCCASSSSSFCCQSFSSVPENIVHTLVLLSILLASSYLIFPSLCQMVSWFCFYTVSSYLTFLHNARLNFIFEIGNSVFESALLPQFLKFVQNLYALKCFYSPCLRQLLDCHYLFIY